MNMVTILLVVFGTLAYAGLGYWAIKICSDFNNQLWQALYDKGIKLADEDKIDQTKRYDLVDEYNHRTSIGIKNIALWYVACATICSIWPITTMVNVILDYAVYCKLMKKANQL